jgi:hypothetical protein
MLKRDRFLDEHDGDVVFDAIFHLACGTDEGALVFFQNKSALALGTGKDIDQLLVNGHKIPPGYRMTPAAGLCQDSMENERRKDAHLPFRMEKIIPAVLHQLKARSHAAFRGWNIAVATR